MKTSKDYKMLTPGSRVAISLKTLFEAKPSDSTGIAVTDAGHALRHTTENGQDYYDLDNGETAYACCDGEEVTVVSSDHGGEKELITFKNDSNDLPTEFRLSISECETAIFGLK